METAVDLPSIKQIMRNVADALPEDATWDDVDYELDFVRTAWNRLQRKPGERAVTHENLKQQLGIH